MALTSAPACIAAVQRHLLLNVGDHLVVFFVLDEQHGETLRLAVCAHADSECAGHEVPFFGEEIVDLDAEGFGVVFYDQFLFHSSKDAGRWGLLVRIARLANARLSREKDAQDG